MGKCFCHFNGYEVKDAAARRDLELANERIYEVDVALGVERSRINQFTALPDGSTSGDAELFDARVDKDGNVHTNVGEHIRSVHNQLSNDIVRDYTIKEKHGKLIKITDAIPTKAVYLSANAKIYSMNMIKMHAMNRTYNGVSFSVDENDPNKITVKGTATENAYSYGTITTENANLLKAGTYYLKTYLSDPAIKIYFDFISLDGVKTTNVVNSEKLKSVYVLNLENDTYVGIRIQIVGGKTVDATLSIMITEYFMNKWYPEAYYPYFEPRNDKMLSENCVVVNEYETQSVEYYTSKVKEYAKKIKVGTFNVGNYCGGYDYNEVIDIPTGDMGSYAKYISSLNTDILCTQEDREYYCISEEITMGSVLYNHMFMNGGVVSKAYSHGNTIAKGLYANFNMYNMGKYTFVNQGTNQDLVSTMWNSFSYCYIDVNGKEILLLSVHLSPWEHNTEVRKKQIREILDFISNLNNEYVIICGDFNTHNAAEMEIFTDNGYILANGGLYGDYATYDSENLHTYDNIIVTDNLLIANVEVHSNDFKDHYAITADIIV